VSAKKQDWALLLAGFALMGFVVIPVVVKARMDKLFGPERPAA